MGIGEAVSVSEFTYKYRDTRVLYYLLEER